MQVPCSGDVHFSFFLSNFFEKGRILRGWMFFLREFWRMLYMTCCFDVGNNDEMNILVFVDQVLDGYGVKKLTKNGVTQIRVSVASVVSAEISGNLLLAAMLRECVPLAIPLSKSRYHCVHLR